MAEADPVAFSADDGTALVYRDFGPRTGAAIVLCGFAAEGNRGKVLVSDDFTGPELQKPWKVMKGGWKISDGVLTGAEIAEDKHAAVIRRPLKVKKDGVEIPFQLNGAQTVH